MFNFFFQKQKFTSRIIDNGISEGFVVFDILLIFGGVTKTFRNECPWAKFSS